jgi:hypothetical protein
VRSGFSDDSGLTNTYEEILFIVVRLESLVSRNRGHLKLDNTPDITNPVNALSSNRLLT